MREVLIYDELLEFSDNRDIVSGTPQYKAFEFLVTDQRVCPSDTNLPQRYALAVLYYSSQGGGWKRCFESDTTGCENEPWLSSESECNWEGVVCNGAGQVQEVVIGKC